MMLAGLLCASNMSAQNAASGKTVPSQTVNQQQGSASSQTDTRFQNLAQARRAASAAKTPDALMAVLKTAMLQLQAPDALELLKEFEPRLSNTALRAECNGLLGTILLLLGRRADAALYYARAATFDPAWTSLAFRTTLASRGEADARPMMEALSARDAAAFTIASAWMAILTREPREAADIIRELRKRTADASIRRELLFLLMIAEEHGEGAVSTRDTLVKEYAASPEAAVATGKASLASPLMLVLGMPLLPSTRSAVLSSGSEVLKPVEKADRKENAQQWLQAGYFASRENAERLASMLKSKGFVIRVETSVNRSGEPRWAVLVGTASDWQATQQKLKDLGIESYLASP